MVQNLTASQLSSTSLRILWKQPMPSNGKLSNYTIQYRANSSTTLKNLTTMENQINITNLKPFTVYKIRVSFHCFTYHV